MKNTDLGYDFSDDFSSDKFRLVIHDLRSLEIRCREAPFPGISTNPQQIPNSMNRINVAGSKVEYEPLTITFNVDRDMRVFRDIHRWIRDTHSPQTFEGFNRMQEERAGPEGNKYVSDASLFSLTNNFNPNIEFRFRNLFPTSLSSISTGLGTTNVVVGTVTFQYDWYEILDTSHLAD